jgi:ABC-2 type transport system permease protein
MGRLISQRLKSSGFVEIIETFGNHEALDEETAKNAVAQGKYQFCIIVSKGITESVKKEARRQVLQSLSMSDPSFEKKYSPQLMVYFDPSVRGPYRAAVLNSLQRVVLGLEIKEKMKILSKLLPKKTVAIVKKAMGGPYVTEDMIKKAGNIDVKWSNDPIFHIKEETSFQKSVEIIPTSVQQNVPSWTLFGIFFIVVPMSGALIKERLYGTLLRLQSMPVSYMTLLAGKVVAYVIICFCQFALILFIGQYILPLFGTHRLDIGSEPGAVMLITLCSALAATGFGMMLGTVARTFEQAAMFGSISVVIAAALGGVMVPVYAMPLTMQKISGFSPLAWGLNGYLELFVRRGNLQSVILEIVLLLAFFMTMLLISWIFAFRRFRSD